MTLKKHHIRQALDELDVSKEELVEILGWVFELVDNSEELVKKLDVILPKVNSIIGFQALRASRQVYDGPDPTLNIEAIRALLDLPSPAAKERDFWPDDFCKTCDGSGKVLPQTGILPQHAQLQLELCVRSVPDRERAYRFLRSLKANYKASEARAILDRMEDGIPFPVEATSRQDSVVQGWTEIGAEFLYIRRPVWPCYDICSECKGTGNRGLPEGYPFEFGENWPEAPVELSLLQENPDGSYSTTSQEEFERLFRVFVRGENSDG